MNAEEPFVFGFLPDAPEQKPTSHSLEDGDYTFKYSSEVNDALILSWTEGTYTRGKKRSLNVVQ